MSVNIFEKYGIKEVANVYFEALDDDLFALCGGVEDASVIGSCTVYGLHPFTVSAFVYDDGIALVCQLCRFGNRQKRAFVRTCIVIVTQFGNVIFSCHDNTSEKIYCYLIVPYFTENIKNFMKMQKKKGSLL